MSDEIVNEAPVAEAPAPEASAPVEQQSQGFDSPFSAFRHLPEFSGQDDLAIAQDLYRSKQGYLESQRVLSQYQNLIPRPIAQFLRGGFDRTADLQDQFLVGVCEPVDRGLDLPGLIVGELKNAPDFRG